MRSIEIKHPRVLAFILLVLELAIILYCSFAAAENHARYTGGVEIDTSDMNLTFKEDVSFEEDNETITIPKGTVIKPEIVLFTTRTVGFYYSTEGLSPEECKSVDRSKRAEKGIYYFSAKPQNFENHEELDRLCDEAIQQVYNIRLKVFLKLFISVLCFCLVWLVVWIILCRKQKTALLYVMDIVLIPIFLFITLFLFAN